VDTSHLDFDTLAVQAGLRMRVGDTTSTVAPISASTTFTYDSVEEVHAALGPDGRGFAYARNANPTVVALEEALALLEGAEAVVAFGSGMAAIHAALLGVGLESGDVVLAASDLYGVTRGLLAQLENLGVHTDFVNILDLEQVEQALTETRARVLYFESISNPLLRIPDVSELTRLAHSHRAIVVIDNTFATPYLFRPLALGADIVVHSATKYIAGHGDVTAGLVAGNRSYGKRIRDTRTIIGSILSPFEAWLTLRGVRTLPLRMARQADSALEIAHWLDRQDWVEHVYYPGLAAHPQHEIAHRQFSGRYGGMVAFDLAAGQRETLRFLDALQLIAPGTSLGDVESLVLYPPLSSHRGLTPGEQRTAGIGEGLVRMSVGLESPGDLIADLEGAASGIGLPRPGRVRAEVRDEEEVRTH
jgi:cystathionine gamma-synthase/methionine-gamma-lyase